MASTARSTSVGLASILQGDRLLLDRGGRARRDRDGNAWSGTDHQPLTAPREWPARWPCPISSPAVKVALARPRDVGASEGCIAPSVVENVTTVLSCTGVPPASVTVAVTAVEPAFGSDASATTRHIVDWVGPTSGPDSHAAQPDAGGAAADVATCAVGRRAETETGCVPPRATATCGSSRASSGMSMSTAASAEWPRNLRRPGCARPSGSRTPCPTGATATPDSTARRRRSRPPQGRPALRTHGVDRHVEGRGLRVAALQHQQIGAGI